MSQTGRPGAYSRSFNGLLGALVVTVVVVVGFVAFRGVFREQETFTAQPVDYLQTVREAQAGGVDLVYPADLPSGWVATDVDFRPGEVPAFSVSLLTPDREYVGVVEEDTPREDLLTTYVDDDYTDADPLEVPDGVAPRWEGYADSGGDTAYAAEVDGRQVLVFGSAPPDVVADVVGALTTRRLAAPDDGAAQPTG